MNDITNLIEEARRFASFCDPASRARIRVLADEIEQLDAQAAVARQFLESRSKGYRALHSMRSAGLALLERLRRAEAERDKKWIPKAVAELQTLRRAVKSQDSDIVLDGEDSLIGMDAPDDIPAPRRRGSRASPEEILERKCPIQDCAVCAWGKTRGQVCENEKCRNTIGRLFTAMHCFETLIAMEGMEFHEELLSIAQGEVIK